MCQSYSKIEKTIYSRKSFFVVNLLLDHEVYMHDGRDFINEKKMFKNKTKLNMTCSLFRRVYILYTVNYIKDGL